ncbi:hypothetical protein EV1_039366 [Malus domestica]
MLLGPTMNAKVTLELSEKIPYLAETCCNGLKTVLEVDASCLYVAFKRNAQLGVVLNVTKDTFVLLHAKPPQAVVMALDGTGKNGQGSSHCKNDCNDHVYDFNLELHQHCEDPEQRCEAWDYVADGSGSVEDLPA